MKVFYIGIDIQLRRGCSYAVIDQRGTLVDSGWMHDPVEQVIDLVKKFKTTAQVQVGVDAPRMPLFEKRKWFWGRKKREWKQRDKQNGYGRHCEIVLSVHRIANPQWTPTAGNAPAWMQLGFEIYSALGSLKKAVRVHEVFPSASYTLLQGIHDVRLNIDFSNCKPGPKDMLDAWIAATVREFAENRGSEVGGGDGLGTIVLPRKLPDPVIEEVLIWPSN